MSAAERQVLYGDSDAPKISTKETEHFLNSITPEDLNNIAFDDSLLCYDAHGNTVGQYSCTLHIRSEGGNTLAAVHVLSEGTFEDMRSTIKLSAELSLSLDTLTQVAEKRMEVDGGYYAKTTTVERKPDGYEVTTENEGRDNIKEIKKYSKVALNFYVSEAANLVLQRLLVKKGFSSPFEVCSLDLNGCPSRALYIDLGERHIHINGEEVLVHGIQRVIDSKGAFPSTWQTYYIEDGHLILRLQVGSPVTMRVERVPQIFIQEAVLSVPQIPKAILDWRDDMELYSRFLDQKEALKADYVLYLREHPLVKEMLSDFMGALMLRKPEDTIHFAVEFFKSYSPAANATNTFLSSQAN
ncbi:unnamed protein product [Calicophoron daubneyi]|uniref:Ciliogenesis-associated TTC17-interacting protein N-terminal domain-containing protein n=1 Tax=Calicophoron daubneyi TaxID=300641 RepID=A0AAV2TBU2_CALDB